MKAVALLSIFLMFFLAFSIPSYAYYDINSYADSWIDKSQPSRNWGSATGMYAGLIGNMSVAFNLSIIPYSETIIGADMWLQRIGCYTSTNFSVYNVSYFNEYNITYNNQPVEDTFQSSITTTGNINTSVVDSVVASHHDNNSVYFKITGNFSPTGIGFYTKENGIYIPFLRVYTASGSGCNASDSYYVGSVCLDQDTFYTNDGCNYGLTDCPTGSYCVQLTPQVNVTGDLYEDLIDCQVWTSLGTAQGLRVNCINVCYGRTVLYSTCYEDECKQCPNDYGYIYVNDVENYFTETYYTDQTTVSVPDYTVACGYPNGTYVPYNETGGVTTIIDILTRAGNNVTTASPSGTPLQPEDEGTSGLKEWINSSMGTNFGADIISLITAGFIATMIFINVGKDDKSSSLLFGSFMMVASVFSFIGLLTFWFLFLEIALIFIMVFWKVNNKGV